MGNEQSNQGILKECTIDDNPIVQNGSKWSLHHAQLLKPPNPMSVFIGDDNTSLENFAKNLRLYRHPDILRFINVTNQGNTIYLFTEKVSPLSVVQKTQSLHQISLGLQKLIKALAFLHTVAKVSHKHLDLSSVFVTPEGNWKLAGLDCVEKLTGTTLKEDLNGFVKLVQELISDVAGVEAGLVGTFIESIRTQIPDSDAAITKSPFEELLTHPFIQDNDFVSVENFLTNLPVKTFSERAHFFQTLADRLQKLPANLVASQLAPLLLSRLVMLDPNAVQYFLPQLLTPNSGLLPETLFKEKLIPLLINIYHVRDMQIRLVLLKFFANYVEMFTENQLEDTVLPLVLLGIHDVNDRVVAETLKALSVLVLKVGSAKVIGGKKRRKIFSDGSPSKCQMPINEASNSIEASRDANTILTMSRKRSESYERQSPIGAETSDEETVDLHQDSKSNAAIVMNFDQDWAAAWEESDVESHHNKDENVDEETDDKLELNKPSSALMVPKVKETATAVSSKLTQNEQADEHDFFADMTPVIVSTTKLKLEDTVQSDRFAVHVTDDGDAVENEVGWSDVDDEAWS